MNYKILIIDDEQAVRISIKNALENIGYDLVFAENGQEGLILFKKYKPILIILDLRMPVLDGLDFLQEIRVKPSDPYSVIILTGHGHNKEIKNCFNLGVTSFLRKPFNIYELIGQVKSSINSKLKDISLQKAKNELEQRVEDRTKQLQEMNETLKQKVQELIQAKEEAQFANDVKNQFLSNISHEIRTPFNGIIALTELTLNSDLDIDQRENLEIVKKSSYLLSSLLEDILDFSKLKKGIKKYEEVTFNLPKIIDAIIASFTDKANSKKIKLNYQIHPDIPNTLVGFAGGLKQTLMNLIGNGIKFNKKNGDVSLTIEKVSSLESCTKAETDDGLCLHFIVTDTGIGIPKEKQQMIFDSFTQVDGSLTRKYGGAGLGLSISKRLVETMNGKIWLESEVDKGSQFHFLAQFDNERESLTCTTDFPLA